MIKDPGIRWLVTILAVLVAIIALILLAFFLMITPGAELARLKPGF